MLAALFACLAIAQPIFGDRSDLASIEIRLNADREVAVADVVRRLAEAGKLDLEAPASTLTLPVDGISGKLTRSFLADCLGPEFTMSVRGDTLVLAFPRRLVEPAGRAVLKERLEHVADGAEKAAKSREDYGFKALTSYRPNDPSRPTVCLVHGLNSSSGGFVHMIRPLEEAGYGIVVFDYPFNRPLEESCERFRRDWKAFRRQRGETRRWAVVGHSMGCLVSRSLVEGADESEAADVASLILIAPVNQGSHIARLQNVLQLINGVIAVNDRKKARAFAVLADGVGKAAEDLLPGSQFLVELNRNKRAERVPYHILAGDLGFVTREVRNKLQARIDETFDQSGFVGMLAKLALKDLPQFLDEISDETGDGCVSVDRTRLEGVKDHTTVHANHAELIRAPVLFADPGPVVCVPYLQKWLKQDIPPASSIARPPSGAVTNPED